MAGDTMQAKRRATYEDLMRVPDTMVAEIVDGELVVSPRPACPRALAGSEISADLLPAFHGSPARTGAGGWWILIEPELHFAEDVLVPDIAAWRCRRMAVVPNTAAITLPPDWVCEIISPSSVRHDRIAKMRCYARNDVETVWLVDPLARTLEAFRQNDGQWSVTASHAGDEVVHVEPFAELEIRLERWWLPATDPA
jgi:Uma2 family endonuclease